MGLIPNPAGDLIKKVDRTLVTVDKVIGKVDGTLTPQVFVQLGLQAGHDQRRLVGLVLQLHLHGVDHLAAVALLVGGARVGPAERLPREIGGLVGQRPEAAGRLRPHKPRPSLRSRRPMTRR